MKWTGGYIKMARLTFQDIDEWTPSSISIVDEPSHPLCKFEVYEDDEEYVKKSIDINGENMVDQNTSTENKVAVSESFLERILGRSIAKSEPTEPPAQPPAKNDGDKSAAEKIMEKLESMEKKIDAIDGRVSKLETGEDPKPEGDDPAPGAVNKNDDGTGEGEGEGEQNTEQDPEPQDKDNDKDKDDDKKKEEDDVLDTKSVVAKSQELDPDHSTIGTTDKSLMERYGRNDNGMTW